MNNGPDSQFPPECGQPRLILVVDDDPLILGLVERCLQIAGYDVVSATSSLDALALIAGGARDPDLAVLDVSMPGMSGLELAARLQQTWHIPSMFLTASEDPATVRQASERGALGYLVKPVDPAHIAPSVQAALARADEIRQLRANESRLTAALLQGRETGMAVGILMERYKTDQHTAFRMLRDQARNARRKLIEVAGELLDGTGVADPYAGHRDARGGVPIRPAGIEQRTK
ncbi:MAG: response regulator [Pseudomonadota bacterium]